MYTSGSPCRIIGIEPSPTIRDVGSAAIYNYQIHKVALAISEAEYSFGLFLKPLAGGVSELAYPS